MAVSVDVVTEDEIASSANPTSTSHAGGTPKGIVALIIINNPGTSADVITGVTYDGAALTRVQHADNQTAQPSSGAAYLYFLGSSVAAGTKSLAISGATNKKMQVVIVTLDGTTDLEIVDSDLVENADIGDPSVTLTYGGRTCISLGNMITGKSDVADVTVLSGMTALPDYDFGSRVAHAAQETAAGATDFTFGWTYDVGTRSCALVAAAISETTAGATVTAVGDFDIVYDGQKRLVITGTNFEASQGAGGVFLDTQATKSGSEEAQVETAWSDTSITVDISTALTAGAQYLLVENNSAAVGSQPITLRDTPGSDPVVIQSPSSVGIQSGVPITNFNAKERFYDHSSQLDALDITISGLPAGLSLNKETLTIEGTPESGTSAGSPYTVTLTATDLDGNSINDVFDIDVSIFAQRLERRFRFGCGFGLSRRW